jgi:hypothetical protein
VTDSGRHAAADFVEAGDLMVCNVMESQSAEQTLKAFTSLAGRVRAPEGEDDPRKK